MAILNAGAVQLSKFDGAYLTLSADSLIRLRPAVPEDVLVQRLATAHSEAEAAVEQDRRGCRGLGHDPRMDRSRQS